MMTHAETQNAPHLYLITQPLSKAQAKKTSEQSQTLINICQKKQISAVLIRFELDAFPTLETSKDLKALISAIQETGSAALIEITASALLPQDGVRLVHYLGADGVHLAITSEGGSMSGALGIDAWRKACGTQLIVGAGRLPARHDAMEAGEKGADYLMFGDTYLNGKAQTLSALVERTSWWARLFSVPCVAHAITLDAIPALLRTGCEFIALGDALWNAPEGAEKAFEQACALLVAQETV